VRLATASHRYPVHHLCERLEFVKACEFIPYVASALERPDDHGIYQPVRLPEVPEALSVVSHSPSLALSHGLMELDWHWAPPRQEYLAEAVSDEKAWWWRGHDGMITIRLEDDEARGTTVLMQFAACPLENLADYLMDFRRLVAWLGYERAGWMAPLHPDLLPILEATGFQRDWEHAMYLYEKVHPGL